MEEMHIDPRRDTHLKTLIIGAEPHSDEQRRRIEQMLGVKPITLSVCRKCVARGSF